MSSKDQENISKLSFHFYNSIKVLASFYEFIRLVKIKNITNEKLFLIDKKWFAEYKKFYLFNDLFQLINKFNITNFESENIEMLFNNLFKTFYNINKNYSNILIFYNKDEELPKIISIKDNESICYVNNFDIINEKTLLNLRKSMGDFKDNIIIKDNIDFKLSEDKIIIKYIQNKDICFNLIIGSLNYKDFLNENFFPEILVNFKLSDDLETEFKSDKVVEKFCQYNNNNEIIHIDNYLLQGEINSLYKIAYLCKGYKNLNERGLSRISSKNNEYKNIIIFLMTLYENYEEIFKKFQLSSYQELDLYLVNKNWIDKYKNFYSYSDIVDNMQKNPKAKDILYNIINSNNYLLNKDSLSELIDKIKNLNNNLLIFDLSNINLAAIDYIYPKIGKPDKDCIIIFHNFELWTEIALHYFKKIGFKSNLRKMKCFFSEKFLFILEERKADNIFIVYEYDEIYKYFFESILIKCQKKENILNNIKSNTFIEYLNNFYFNENSIANLEDSNGFILILNIFNFIL